MVNNSVYNYEYKSVEFLNHPTILFYFYCYFKNLIYEDRQNINYLVPNKN